MPSQARQRRPASHRRFGSARGLTSRTRRTHARDGFLGEVDDLKPASSERGRSSTSLRAADCARRQIAG